MMSFRVTNNLMAMRALSSARVHTRNLATIQEQLTTGLRINRPSDDPIGTRALLSYRSESQRYEMDRGNIQAARDELNSSVSQLLAVKDALVTAKTIALDSTNNFERDLLAEQVEQLFDRVVQLANSQVDGDYLFSGTAIHTQPFVDEGADGVVYRGADQRATVVVGVGLTVESLYRGREIFQSRERGPTQISGHTGALPGNGSDSGVGRMTLTVTHTATTYAGASGIQPGVSSVANDSIIGPLGAHRLEIDDTSGNGSSGTIRLNDGLPVAFTNLDTDLMVIGPRGEEVFVDTTGITAGFQGTVDIAADGTLSIDGNATTLPIDFTDAQPVIDGASQRVTHVDSRQIVRVGEARVDHEGTIDIFRVISQFRDDLVEGRDVAGVEWQQRVNGTIGDFDRFIEGILAVVGEQSATLESLDAIEIRNEDVQLELERIVAGIESADITEAIVNLQSEQNLLQYTYAATARLFQLNLLNFIR